MINEFCSKKTLEMMNLGHFLTPSFIHRSQAEKKNEGAGERL